MLHWYINSNVSPKVCLDGKALKFVNEFKYLGHIITSDFKDDSDIDRVRRSLCKQGNMILSRFAKASGKVKIILFKSFCIDLYGAELWNTNRSSSLKAIRVMYHDLVKRLVGIRRQMNNHLVCHDFSLFTFDKLLAYRKINFFLKVLKCSYFKNVVPQY